MKLSIKTGFCFGLTSGVITTLGLIVGLYAGTHSKLAVVGGIITIAIADALSDALGIHISEESKNHRTEREVWESTFSTLLSKFIFAISFMAPVLLLELHTAVVVSVLWGLCLITLLSFQIARSREENPISVISEHILIALLVIAITHYVGVWVNEQFG